MLDVIGGRGISKKHERVSHDQSRGATEAMDAEPQEITPDWLSTDTAPLDRRGRGGGGGGGGRFVLVREGEVGGGGSSSRSGWAEAADTAALPAEAAALPLSGGGEEEEERGKPGCL